MKAWYADIGTRVAKGQKLADIESPEVDQQLQQARADLQTTARTRSSPGSRPTALQARRLPRRVPAGVRQRGQRVRRAARRDGLGESERRASRAARGVRADRGALRRHHHGPEHRRRPARRLRKRRRAGARALSDRLDRQASRLRGGSGGRLRGREGRRPGGAHVRGKAGQAVSGHDRPERRRHQPRHSDAPRRSRSRQSERRDPAGRLRAGPPEARERGARRCSFP